MSDDPAPADVDHRRLAVDANNSAWELLLKDSLTDEERAELLERAGASAHHWRHATDEGAVERVRAAWLLARAHTVAGHEDAAAFHADRCHQLTDACTTAADFDRAYALEAVARAAALRGDDADAAELRAAARAVEIADDEDREIVEGDIEGGPWFGLG